MSHFNFIKTELKEVFLIDNFYAGDTRGGFRKCFEKDCFANAGIDFELSETFVSVSSKNVIRGLHFQINRPQAKLVCVLKGAVWDVVVDLRPHSTTYQKWISVELNERNSRAIYVPRGFAHGFAALENESIMLYQCDGAYDKETDTGIMYNAPELGIVWPVKETEAIHSQRDLMLMSFAEYERNPMKA